MPGRGRGVEQPRQTFEVFGNLEGLLAATTLDIYLNDMAYWRNMPAHGWNYTIGGYQVIEKWLSYREKTLLGRGRRSRKRRKCRTWPGHRHARVA